MNAKASDNTTTVGRGNHTRATVQDSGPSGAHVVVTAGNNATLQAAQVVATAEPVAMEADMACRVVESA